MGGLRAPRSEIGCKQGGEGPRAQHQGLHRRTIRY